MKELKGTIETVKHNNTTGKFDVLSSSFHIEFEYETKGATNSTIIATEVHRGNVRVGQRINTRNFDLNTGHARLQSM